MARLSQGSPALGRRYRGTCALRDHLQLLVAADDLPAFDRFRHEPRRHPARTGGNARTDRGGGRRGDRSHEARSEEHTSELQSLMRISYAVFCLKKKKNIINNHNAKNTHYIIDYKDNDH